MRRNLHHDLCKNVIGELRSKVTPRANRKGGRSLWTVAAAFVLVVRFSTEMLEEAHVCGSFPSRGLKLIEV